MQMTLTEDDAALLREALSIYLSDLRREIIHTDAHDFRAQLVARERLLERLVAELSPATVSA